LVFELQLEESRTFDDYDMRMNGVWEKKKQRKLIRTDEIKAIVNYYKNMETLLRMKKSDRNDFVELWIKCLKDLNIKINN